MELPEFPDFQEVDISLKPVVQDFLRRFPLEASEYTFTNIFAFRKAYEFELSQLKYDPHKSHHLYPVDIYSAENLKQSRMSRFR